MPLEENKNKAGDPTSGNPGGDSSGSSGPNTGPTGASNPLGQESQPAKPFEEPKVIEAQINPKQKAEEGKTPFSFTNPKAVHEQYSAPSKGDAARIEEKSSEKDNRSDAEKLAALRAEIAKDEKSDQPHSYSDYHDTAEMFILGYEATLMFLGRLISKDTSDTAYGFSEPTRQKLIYQATKVSCKRNWVIPIEYMFAGTILPATAGVLLKAKDKRTEYFKNNPVGKEVQITKGGPYKGMPRKRGPGRPKI